MPHDFYTDVGKTAECLLDAFDLKFEEQEQHLSDPVLRWLDYRLRYIDQRRRQTLKSVGFDARLPTQAGAALQAFIQLSEAGGNLNPYQSKTIKRHDSSGMKPQLRTDGLWADWGIHHAHLTIQPLAAGEEFSARSEWLLFFMVFPDHLALIDVRSHGEADIFQAIDLFKMVVRSWPDVMKRFAIKGIVGVAGSQDTTAESIRSLRTAGVAQIIEIDGTVYTPLGLGVTTAATSTKVSLKRDEVNRLLHSLGNYFIAADGEPMRLAGSKGLTNPTFSLGVLPQGGLVVECLGTDLQWPLTSATSTSGTGFELEHLLLPPWASAVLLPYLAQQQSAGGPGAP